MSQRWRGPEMVTSDNDVSHNCVRTLRLPKNSNDSFFLFPTQLTNAIKAGIIIKSNFYKFGPGWIRDRSDHILKSRLVRKLLISPLVNSWTCLNDTWRLGIRFAHQEESQRHLGTLPGTPWHLSCWQMLKFEKTDGITVHRNEPPLRWLG